MIYQIRDIEKDVRVALDENGGSASLLNEGDSETLTLDELIRSKLEEVSRAVIQSSDVTDLDGGHTLGRTDTRGNLVYDIDWGPNNRGRLLLPEDFLRCVVFMMSDWERPVYEFIGVGVRRYRLQYSKEAGLRGSSERPVAAIVMRPEGLTLEFFGCESEEAKVLLGSYIRKPRIDSEGGIEIPEGCYRRVINGIAQLVAEATGLHARGQRE